MVPARAGRFEEELQGFGFLFGADVGEIDYRERCRDNIVAALEAEPLWDGVLLDDVNSTLAGHRSRVDGGRHEPVHERLADGSLEQLPYEDYLDGTNRPDPATDEEWELRVGGLLEAVGSAVRERERLVIANFCCEERNEAWGGYLDHVAGGLSEFFVKYPPPASVSRASTTARLTGAPRTAGRSSWASPTRLSVGAGGFWAASSRGPTTTAPHAGG